jgi:hypothetical protein
MCFLLAASKQGVGIPLLTENESGSIPEWPAKNIQYWIQQAKEFIGL